MIYRNDVVIKQILKSHPTPNVPYYLNPILDALGKLSSERQYIAAGDAIISGRIPYSSLLMYMKAKVDIDLQEIFEDLFLYADECWFNKSEEMRNRNRKRK